MTRRHSTFALVLTVTLALVGACGQLGGNSAFCEAIQAPTPTDYDELAAKYQRIADTAPPELKADAQIVADGMKPVSGHPAEEFDAATKRLAAAAERYCT